MWKFHFPLNQYSTELNCVLLEKDGYTKILATYDINNDIWKLSDYYFVEGDFGNKNTLTISNDNHFIASENVLNFPYTNVIDFIRQESVSTFDHNINFSLAFSYDNKYLASGYEDSLVNIWNIEDGSFIKSYSYSNFKRWHAYDGWTSRGRIIPAIRALAFSPDGKYLAAGNDDASVIIWNIDLTDVYEPEIEIANLKILPNPIKDKFKLTFNLEYDSEIIISVYNILGLMLSEQSRFSFNGSNEIYIDISNLQNGTYFVRFQNNNYEKIIPIVKYK